MQCLYPRTVGFKDDGKTISWSPKQYNKEFSTFKLPCGKCIKCRLEYARQWAIRCVHESKMYEQNSFITLTYSDEKLTSSSLQYRDFQLFIKRLRKHIFTQFLNTFGKYNWSLLTKEEKKEHYAKIQIGIFVTGEYGDKRKRPHWHAILFNWQPADLKYKYTSDHGDRVCSSTTLDNLWGYGITEIGTVTFHSAGYCARYAAKKLVHGHDGHAFQPISKKSSRHAIGKKFLEKYWKDIFTHGHIILEGGIKTTIPRYYEKWLLKEKPDEYIRYVTEVKYPKTQLAEKRFQEKIDLYHETNRKRGHRANLVTDQEIEIKLINERFKILQSHLKGDI